VCAKCGWKGWKRRHDGSGTPASETPGETAGRTAPNTFYRSRRYGSGPGSRARGGEGRRRRWVGREETPGDVLKAVLIVLVALAVIWGAAQACSILRPPQDDASQQ
jgi:hypothetical protein